MLRSIRATVCNLLYDLAARRVPVMNDQYTDPGDHIGRPLVRESRENLTFAVNREVFVSREIFEREQRAVFDRCWIYLGHASELRNPGDYKTRSLACRPVIFCRDRNGEVRVL